MTADPEASEILKELRSKSLISTSGEPLSLKEKMKQAISKRLLADQSIMNQLQGEFCVVKGYGNQEAADLFAVSGAHKAKNGDHYLYTINVKP